MVLHCQTQSLVINPTHCKKLSITHTTDVYLDIFAHLFTTHKRICTQLSMINRLSYLRRAFSADRKSGFSSSLACQITKSNALRGDCQMVMDTQQDEVFCWSGVSWTDPVVFMQWSMSEHQLSLRVQMRTRTCTAPRRPERKWRTECHRLHQTVWQSDSCNMLNPTV